MSELKQYTHVAEELDAETNKYALYAYDVDGNRTKIDDTELVYLKSEADKVIADLEESHKKEVEQLLMEIAGLKKLVETAEKLIKTKCGFTVKDVKFGGVKLEGINTHKKEA